MFTFLFPLGIVTLLIGTLGVHKGVRNNDLTQKIAGTIAVAFGVAFMFVPLIPS